MTTAISRPSYARMAQHASFEHERLKLSDKSIRLFQVQRGGKNEPVALRMTQFSAHRRPAYKAVSYTWGSPENPKQILVNGKAFALHVNLWTLLYHLRLENETAFLWADALCINQFNLKERNFHVQLMGRIYEKAESVIVWLGVPGPERIEIRAMDFVKEMAAFRKTNSDATFVQTFMRKDLQHRWRTLRDMCKPPNPDAYWNRTWVIQEFLFAQSIEVLAGRERLDWKEFEELLDFLRTYSAKTNDRIIAQILQSRTARLTMRRRAAGQSNLIELLQEYSDSSCTERRDKIYGILGLAADCAEDPETGQAKGVKPDYEKHIVDVYLEALTCVQVTLPTSLVLPAAALLILQSLHIQQADFASYVTDVTSNTQQSALSLTQIVIKPEYVSPVIKTIPWISARDLQQSLELEPWGDYIGWEVKKVVSNSALNPVTPRLRRLSSRTIHSNLPEDLIPNVVEAANLCTDLAGLHNYPCDRELIISTQFLPLHPQEKASFENSNLQKPPIILEQRTDSESIRLGFACTNTQRGDSIVQFTGLDTALIVRQVWHEYKLVGKAMMVRHSGLQHDAPGDPICAMNQWSSHCWYGNNPEGLHFETDPLSLAELLTRAS